MENHDLNEFEKEYHDRLIYTFHKCFLRYKIFKITYRDFVNFCYKYYYQNNC